MTTMTAQAGSTIELGTRREVLPGSRLAVSASVFKSDMDNARVTAPDGTSQNVDRKELKGVELGLSGRITDAWTVFGGYTYLSAASRRRTMPAWARAARRP